MGGHTEWFILRAPKATKGKTITKSVQCDPLCSILKTKNLYLTFDDENGIGTMQYMAGEILKGTGWTLGECDTFLEKDGKNEKVRTLKSSGKSGAYKLIADACNLFNAYPTYDSENKTVSIHALNNKKELREMTMGKDLNSLAVEVDSTDIITRLYVEGEYGDYGYVGIDDVNPTGLTYLLNFDYYRSIGVFTAAHEAALTTYLGSVKTAIDNIRETAKKINAKEDEMSALWGLPDYVLYPVSNRVLGKAILGGSAEESDAEIKVNDEVYILSDGTYRIETIHLGEGLNLVNGDTSVVKFITKTSAKIGAAEVAIDAKNQLIRNIQKKIDAGKYSGDKLSAAYEQIVGYQNDIQNIYAGTTDAALNISTDGLYRMMTDVVSKAFELDALNTEMTERRAIQTSIETDFVLAMGDLLKDGYWNDTNYTVGQEESLYKDALDVMESASKPSVKYTISLASIAEQFGADEYDLDVNTQIRLYDPDIPINDIVYTDKVTLYLDDPKNNKATITNQDVSMTGVSMDSILSRIANLANLVDQKNALYERAQVIGSNGKMAAERLNGQINILANRLSAATSSWYTDDRGNILFESVDGKSAMMLCGEGFMIAYGKNDDGSWNWRTFGTGEGFTADAIITGYLSAERIEAGSIRADKLENGIGAKIDLSENAAIKSMVTKNDITSEVNQKANELTVSISKAQTTAEGAVRDAQNAQATANNVQQNISTYFRFDTNGLTIGKANSSFTMILTNEKLSFMNGQTEIAYMSNSYLYITKARFTDSFSVGTEANGYFDWITTETGLGIKWRET